MTEVADLPGTDQIGERATAVVWIVSSLIGLDAFTTRLPLTQGRRAGQYDGQPIGATNAAALPAPYIAYIG